MLHCLTSSQMRISPWLRFRGRRARGPLPWQTPPQRAASASTGCTRTPGRIPQSQRVYTATCSPCIRDLGPLRLVTTNFDTLFEEAARESTGVQPEVFPAPALPLGREFHGIVHVHGTIDKPHDMVLTDADFGRAYLTEAWARRFLVDLFRSFTVLFVGYGHSDTVMNYLARALPVEQTRTQIRSY